ncbi:MAG: hypothetical protein V3U67_10125, partial [Gemmatimonadota bacterium]
LWPGIASRIDVASDAAVVGDAVVVGDAAVVGDPAVVPLLPRRRESPSRFAFTAPQLAAAAVVMVLLGGTLTYVAQQGGAPGSTDGPEAGPMATGPDAPNRMPAGLPVFAAATAKYEIAIHELEEGLAAGRSSLAPETVRVIEASLAKIDLAIQEARTALEADPASEYLSRHLTGAMTRKLDVLLQANELVRAQTAQA